MAAAPILYVGDDSCHRIPVIERNGMVVLRSSCSVDGVRAFLANNGRFSAVTFHNDLVAPAGAIVSVARSLCRGPLVLFENSSVECDDRLFDVVIQVPTPPDVWTKILRESIKQAFEIREFSRQLRAECADLREVSRSLREMSARNRISPVDYDGLFRAEGDGMPEKTNDEGDGS